MTSQTDELVPNSSCAFHCSIFVHTFSKNHNFLISLYPILLKYFLIGLSDFSASFKSKFFFRVDKSFKCPDTNKEVLCYFGIEI